ncbi:MAG: flagellar protein FlaG [Pseudomonadales bacterium]
MTTPIDGMSGMQSIRPVVVEAQLPGDSARTVSAAEPEARPEPAMDAGKVAEATRQVEQLFQSVRRNLQFKDDPTSGRMVVSVIDADSGEIIRQIPPERMLRMAANLEQITGLLLGERA